jgi:hypothetical protein
MTVAMVVDSTISVLWFLIRMDFLVLWIISYLLLRTKVSLSTWLVLSHFGHKTLLTVVM